MSDIGKLGARILIALTVFLALATTSVVDVTPAHAQTDEAAALNQQVIKLYKSKMLDFTVWSLFLRL